MCDSALEANISLSFIIFTEERYDHAAINSRLKLTLVPLIANSWMTEIFSFLYKFLSCWIKRLQRYSHH